MLATAERARLEDADSFRAVGLAYIEFALDKPAFFRAMWYEEGIYSNDPVYLEATRKLGDHLRGGFADTLPDDDDAAFSPQELLAWSAVHGLASLWSGEPVHRWPDRPSAGKVGKNANGSQHAESRATLPDGLKAMKVWISA
jgi:hypothetical protein